MRPIFTVLIVVLSLVELVHSGCPYRRRWKQSLVATTTQTTTTVRPAKFPVCFRNLPVVTNGFIGSGGYHIGAIRYVICDPGFANVGPPAVLCLASRRWSLPGTCEKCELPFLHFSKSSSSSKNSSNDFRGMPEKTAVGYQW